MEKLFKIVLRIDKDKKEKIMYLYSNNCFTAMQAVFLKFQKYCSYEHFMSLVQQVQEVEEIQYDQETYWGSLENFEEMKKYRRMPFLHIGQKVIYHGPKYDREGFIVGTENAYCLAVLFVGNDYVSKCHPQYAITYLDEDRNIVEDYSEN